MSNIEQFGYREQLARSLSTLDLIVYGMIFMVPIAPYSVFGFVWHDSKGMVPLAYLIGIRRDLSRGTAEPVCVLWPRPYSRQEYGITKAPVISGI